MGDLVAVFQTGGVLAQFGKPLDILAAPASEFVARFVGQDRGLKRLSLLRVSDVPVRAAVTARPGDPADEARRRALDDPLRYLLMIDNDNRPIGWVAHGDIPAGGPLTDAMANPSSPVLNKRTTLKDALSMMLDADVQTGIVVDRTGAVQGLLSIDTIADKMREGEHAATFDQVPPAEPEVGEPDPGEPGLADEAALAEPRA
jgi:osmoprotectant transport system ATP-binding protein